jgi:hypothetical protein
MVYQIRRRPIVEAVIARGHLPAALFAHKPRIGRFAAALSHVRRSVVGQDGSPPRISGSPVSKFAL